MSWHTTIGGLFSTNANDQRMGGFAEAGHCDRESAICVDTGFGLQAGVGTLQTPTLQTISGIKTVRDYDFAFVGYHGRLGLLFNPVSAFGLGPVLRGGVTHHMVTETLIQTSNGKIQENHSHQAGPFLTAGVQFLLTGKTFGAHLDLGAASYPTLPGLDRNLGFYGQAGARIQF